MKKATIVNIISYLYALLFLYTGIAKFADLPTFRAAIYKSVAIKDYGALLTFTIPTLEMLIALSLLLPFFRPAFWSRKWGLYAGTTLMVLFTIYVGYMLETQAGKLPCTCGGIINRLNWHQHFYFNSGFTLLGLLACWLNAKDVNSEQGKLAFS